ncbi:MAG TPA: hypothetical protein VNL71_04030 [Chloroflexota bacterium]|nr:hypothetical protein [Chloroflexota bacterium]
MAALLEQRGGPRADQHGPSSRSLHLSGLMMRLACAAVRLTGLVVSGSALNHTCEAVDQLMVQLVYRLTGLVQRLASGHGL